MPYCTHCKEVVSHITKECPVKNSQRIGELKQPKVEPIESHEDDKDKIIADLRQQIVELTVGKQKHRDYMREYMRKHRPKKGSN